eukprot:3233389-Rhodomonas_salina.3
MLHRRTPPDPPTLPPVDHAGAHAAARASRSPGVTPRCHATVTRSDLSQWKGGTPGRTPSPTVESRHLAWSWSWDRGMRSFGRSSKSRGAIELRNHARP